MMSFILVLIEMSLGAFPEELISSMGGRNLTLIDTTDIEKSDLFPALIQKLKANGHDFYFVGPFEHEAVLRNLGIEEEVYA